MTAMADLCRVVGDDNLKQEKLGKNALKEKETCRDKSFRTNLSFWGSPPLVLRVCVCGFPGACSVPSTRDD